MPPAAFQPGLQPTPGVASDAEVDQVALALFVAAIDREPVARQAWLAEQCAEDDALRARVLRLLEADADSELTSSKAGGRDVHDRSSVLPPLQIGAYQLEELIGAGGMGAVYRARRNDGLFDQTVAVKFIRPMGGGVQVEPLIDAERRLLARMEHAAIARILDGGTTSNGLHFLVMEYVDGVALDDHVHERGLSTRARVALMREVCAAVAHAHQHLVLHCDLKPANILVTAQGRPKLIDFGVARIQDVIDASLPEGFTRDYTSPQRLAGAPATVADDVYSLGVVLCELVTGVLPDAAALHAALPARPSAARAGGGALSGDLLAIARKALAFDREQRYTSVAAFDDDLQCWLDKRPVAAVAGTWRYRARLLAVRHPLRVASMAFALAGLLVAMGVIAILYVQAEKARLVAEARFAEVRSLANYMLFELDPRLEAIAGTTQARREMIGRGQQYLDALGKTAGDNPQLQREVALGLARLAEVQGGWAVPNVGEADQARTTFERAERMLAELVHRQPDAWAWRADLGRVQYRLADLYGSRDNDAPRQLLKAREAEAQLAQAIAGAGRASSVAASAEHGDRPATTKDIAELQVLLSSTRLAQAFALDYNADHEAAAAIARSEEARMLGLPAAVQQAMELDHRAGRPAMQLGDSMFYAGHYDDALAAYRRALARLTHGLEQAPGQRRLLEGSAMARWSLSATLVEMGRHAEALAEIDAGLPTAEQLVALDANNVQGLRLRSTLRNQRAQVLGQLGRYDEAIAITEANQREREARAAKAPDDAGPARDAAVPLEPLADLYWRKGDTANACRVMRQAAQAWADIDRRWGLSELDRQQARLAAQQRGARCPG